jgi:MoaA/NifB/PqqE/SkfB family radical SAM enzyme
MNKIVKIESNTPKDYLRIELFLSNLCNYKCWYCFPGYNEGTVMWPELELLTKNLAHLINYYRITQNKKTILLHIIGGEPTLWKNFGEFVKIMKTEHNCLISISTNGSRTYRWWDEYGHYLDHIMFSCHHERVDTDHIIKVLDLLYSKDVNITAMVLMDPSAWEKCVSITEKLKTSQYDWSVVAIEVLTDTHSYTEDQKKFFEQADKRLPNLDYWYRTNKRPTVNPTVFFDNGENQEVNHNWISINNLNYFYNWECSIGIETFFIDTNGDIRGGCGQNLYNLDFRYNIYDTDFEKKFKPTIVPVICKNANACSCQPETNASKRKIIPIATS